MFVFAFLLLSSLVLVPDALAHAMSKDNSGVLSLQLPASSGIELITGLGRRGSVFMGSASQTIPFFLTQGLMYLMTGPEVAL